MKPFITILLVALYAVAFAQFGKGNPERISELKDKTLLVCLYDNAPLFNENIKEIVEKRWKYGKYEFVNYREAKTKKRDDVVMLYLYGNHTGTSAAPLTASTLSIGVDKGLYAQIYLDRYARGSGTMSGPFITYGNVSAAATAYINKFSKERLDVLFSVLLNTLESIGKENVDLAIDMTLKDAKRYYNSDENSDRLKNGTLYIPKSDIATKKMMDKVSNELLAAGAIGEIYKGNHEVVSEDDLAKAIAAKAKNTYYLHSALQGSIIIYFVFDLERQKIVYVDFAHGSNGDISAYRGMMKELNKAAGF